MIKRSSSFLRSCWEKIKRVSPRLAFKRILFYESATEYYFYEVGKKTAQIQREREMMMCSRAAVAGRRHVLRTTTIQRRTTTTKRRAATLTTKNNSNKDDEVYRVMSKNQELSVISVTATKMVAEAQGRHKAAPTATAAIGRNLIASLLLGSFKGDEETVQVTFRGDGPLGQLTAVSDNLGNAKCLVGNALGGSAVTRGREVERRDGSRERDTFSVSVASELGATV